VELKSAKAPDTPSDLLTSIQGRNVKIQWTPQSENFDPVTRYEIQIQGSDAQWYEDTVTCDGASETIKATNECLVPLLTLLSNNFNLQSGEKVGVRVAATNKIGTSDYIFTDGVAIVTVPQAPLTVRTGSATTNL
jgi:hypothetical protein